MTTTVRVLTWNLWWRFGDWRRRREAIETVLRDVRPDICCFQEVWSTKTEDAARQLGEQNGLVHAARSYSSEPEHWQRRTGEPGVDCGNAIVSRWPIIATETRELPGADGRTVLATRIATPGGEMPVVCTHLAAPPPASAERCRQVRSVVELLAAFGRDAIPPIVAGDLNAEPDSDEVRLLGGYKTAPAVDGLVLIDAWRRADRGEPGWTWRRDNPYAPAHYALDARIDYLHVGVAGRDGEGTILRAWVVGDHEVGGVWPSDHAAVVADIAV